MNTTRVIAGALLIVVSSLALHAAQAQFPGIKRTGLMQNDLSVPGREVVQVRVEFPPGLVAANHSHPGEELGSRLIKSTIQGPRRGRQRQGNFARACHSGLRSA